MTQKIFQKFKRFIEKQRLFSPNSRLLVAVSGGQDSVALVHLLLELQKEWPELEIALAHFNHHLRVSAKADEKFVRRLAHELGLKIFVGQGRVREFAHRNQLNVEQAGRLKRYEFLEKTAERWSADFILTAHTMTDQAETVLMKIFRGTGIEGLQGIRLRKGKVVRPLLGMKRGEIEEYLRAKGIAYRIDETNLDTELLRNKIRLELIPQLEREYDPELVSHLAQLALIAQAENEALEELVEGLWPLVTRNAGHHTRLPNFQKKLANKKDAEKAVPSDANFLFFKDNGHEAQAENEEQENEIETPEDEIVESSTSPQKPDSSRKRDKIKNPVVLAPELELNLKALEELPVAVARRLVRKFLHVTLGLSSPSFDQTEAALHQQEGQAFSWGKDKVLVNEGGWLKRIRTGPKRGEFSLVWDGQKELYLGEDLVFSGRFTSAENIGQLDFDDENRCYLDAEKLTFPLEVRSRKPGDKYRPLGMRGKKKLKDLLRERKIPQEERDFLPVFISGGKIVWVPGLPVSDEFKIIGKTRKIFLIEKASF
ncbi:MAG: tRNA lysidine(34) synthetase TilS [Candidatus Saccharicenans sp.]